MENSPIIDDPVTGIDPETKKPRGTLVGDLPWDRYYGNYVSIKIADNDRFSDNQSIKNKKEQKVRLNIPVRVLHSVRLDKLKDGIEQLDKEKIQEVMTKIFSYYTRYYPWLHVQYEYTGRPPNPWS